MGDQTEKRLASLEAQVSGFGEQLGEISKDVKALNAQANRWKGAFMVLLAVGGLIGWFADRATQIFK